MPANTVENEYDRWSFPMARAQGIQRNLDEFTLSTGSFTFLSFVNRLLQLVMFKHISQFQIIAVGCFEAS